MQFLYIQAIFKVAMSGFFNSEWGFINLLSQSEWCAFDKSWHGLLWVFLTILKFCKKNKNQKEHWHDDVQANNWCADQNYPIAWWGQSTDVSRHFKAISLPFQFIFAQKCCSTKMGNLAWNWSIPTWQVPSRHSRSKLVQKHKTIS